MTEFVDQTVEEPRTIFAIPEANFAKFEAQVAKLSKRSEKLIGLPIRSIVFGYDYKEIDGATIKVFNVLFSAQTPKIDGWTFVARIDHSQEVGNIIRAVPNTGVTIPEAYRTAKPHCDHCKTLRYRRDTFLLSNDETHEFKQVGTNCLTDFFGHDPQKVAKMAELLGYAVEAARGNEDYTGSTGLQDHRYLELEKVLTFGAKHIRRHGFVSAKAARENETLLSTRERVSTDLHMLSIGALSAAEMPADEDVTTAQAAIEWAQGFCENDNLSDYIHNVCVVARSPYIEYRAMGLAVSIVGVYQREQDKLKPRQSLQIADMTGILKLFDTAGSKLKHPAIVLETTDANGKATTVRLSVAGPQSRFPGSINVTSEGSYEDRAWYGRITKEGAFEGRANAPAGLSDALAAFALDPAGVAASHGRKTGRCAFCNAALGGKTRDAQISVKVGYGKTCASHYGMPWSDPDGDKPRPRKARFVAEAAVVEATQAEPEPEKPSDLDLIGQALAAIGGDALAAWNRFRAEAA